MMLSDVNILSRLFYKLAKINQPKAVRKLDEKLYKELFGRFTDVQEKERGVYAALAYARIKEGENVGIDEAVFDVNSLMATYRSVKSKLEEKDIFKYDSYQEFANKVNQVNLSMGVRNRSSKAKEISREKQEVALENGSAVKVFEDDKNVIFRIDNSQAANAFGSDTSWCITKERGYLESYQSQNATFYFCINKELPQDDPYSKVAIRVIRDFNGNIDNVKFTRKTNDGDDNDISDLQNYENFVEVLKQDTLSLPPSLETKVKNKTASPEEIEEFWEKLTPSSIEEKYGVINRLGINTESSSKISFFVERESKTVQELIDYLKDNPYDAAILEQLAKVSTDQKTLEKLYETKYWNVQKEAAKKVRSNKVIRDAANSDYNEVQAALALNPYVPAGYADYILENFEHDGNIDTYKFTELKRNISNRNNFDSFNDKEIPEHFIFDKSIKDMFDNAVDGPSSQTNKILIAMKKYLDKTGDFKYAYDLAKKNVGIDIEFLQKHACKDPKYAYYFAREIPGANLEYCIRHACKDYKYAYKIAYDNYQSGIFQGANIEFLQEHACKSPEYAYLFAKNIPGANIEYCQEHACKDPGWAFLFAENIRGADVDKIYNNLVRNFGETNEGVKYFKQEFFGDDYVDIASQKEKELNIKNRIK